MTPDQDKPREQLVEELAELRLQVAELRALAPERDGTESTPRRRGGQAPAPMSNEGIGNVQTYLDIAGVILVTIDAGQRVTFINRTGCEVLGWPSEEIVGANWFDRFVPEPDRERTRGGFRQLMEGEIEAVEYFENPVLTQRGAVRTIAWHNTVIRDAEGRVLGSLSSGEDITERRRAEEALREAHQQLEQRVAERTAALAMANQRLALEVEDRKQLETELRESEELHRTVLGSISDAVFIIDDRGSFTYICPNVDNIFGSSQDEVREIGSIGGLLGGPLYRLEDLTKSGELRNIEWQIRDKAGRPHALLVNVKKVSIKEGTVLYTCRDITDRKETQEQLREAKETAEAANRVKSEFLANMSHELRTPLNSILGYAHLILDGVDGPINEDQATSVERIDRNAAHLLHLVDEILDLSRIEAGKMGFAPVVFELAASLDETVQGFQGAAEEKGLRLSCRVEPEVPGTLVGDPDRLRQILNNLVGNAIKFTDSGSITLRVEKKSQNAKEVCLHFAVTDTGIGISTQAQTTIFEPFTQVDGSTTRRYKGAGLGLAISSRLAEKMGGRMWVESRPGEGATFHFTACFTL